VHKDFVWETAYNYTEQREIFRCDFGTRNGAISDIDLSYFFYKEITQQIVRETYRNSEQYKKA